VTTTATPAFEQLAIDPRVVQLARALSELQAMIQAKYPSARFEVSQGHDPIGLHLRAIVDVDDIDKVTDLVLDREVELQIEDGLPVYVFPARSA
jgi:hypothetical protein